MSEGGGGGRGDRPPVATNVATRKGVVWVIISAHSVNAVLIVPLPFVPAAVLVHSVPDRI